MQLPTTFKRLRERAILTQEEVAEAMNRSMSSVSKWDQEIQFPKLRPIELRELMNLFGCTFEELCEAQRNWEDEL